jgi:NIPSNAP
MDSWLKGFFMIIDLRVYTYLPGKFQKFLQGYREGGFALTSRHLGKTLGIFTSESGVQNRTFQFFMYEDSRHRKQCRVGMLRDPEWTTFIKMDSDALLKQQNSVLVPLPFVGLKAPQQGPVNRPADVASRIFELQTYNCHPSGYQAALEMVKTAGVPLLKKHGVDIIGGFAMDTGNEDSFMIMCAYENDPARDAQREALKADPDFISYLRSLKECVSSQDATLLLATPYSPMQ